MLTKDALLNAATVKKVEIEGLAEPVTIKASKYDVVQGWLEDDDGDAKAVAVSVVDEDGKQMLTLEEAKKIDRAIFQRLADEILKVNGMTTTEGPNA